MKLRKWGISNPFSEAHRRSLPQNHCLFDVDGINIGNGGICFYEEKNRMTYSNGYNFIDSFHDEKNTQALFLKTLSLLCDVWICEKISQKFWILRDQILRESEKPKLDFINTENKIYIQSLVNYRSHKLSSVILRTEGIKNNPNEMIADRISDHFSIPKILVNDVHKDSYIYFKSENGEIEESQINDKFEGDWRKIWKKFKIF